MYIFAFVHDGKPRGFLLRVKKDAEPLKAYFPVWRLYDLGPGGGWCAEAPDAWRQIQNLPLAVETTEFR